jgi:hypothetical protein
VCRARKAQQSGDHSKQGEKFPIAHGFDFISEKSNPSAKFPMIERLTSNAISGKIERMHKRPLSASDQRRRRVEIRTAQEARPVLESHRAYYFFSPKIGPGCGIAAPS